MSDYQKCLFDAFRICIAGIELSEEEKDILMNCKRFKSQFLYQDGVVYPNIDFALGIALHTQAVKNMFIKVHDSEEDSDKVFKNFKDAAGYTGCTSMCISRVLKNNNKCMVMKRYNLETIFN